VREAPASEQMPAVAMQRAASRLLVTSLRSEAQGSAATSMSLQPLSTSGPARVARDAGAGDPESTGGACSLAPSPLPVPEPAAAAPLPPASAPELEERSGGEPPAKGGLVWPPAPRAPRACGAAGRCWRLRAGKGSSSQ
jgi:hypothetical protein